MLTTGMMWKEIGSQAPPVTMGMATYATCTCKGISRSDVGPIGPGATGAAEPRATGLMGFSTPESLLATACSMPPSGTTVVAHTIPGMGGLCGSISASDLLDGVPYVYERIHRSWSKGYLDNGHPLQGNIACHA